MDHMRRDEIVAELEGYQHKIRLGFASVTVGDVVQLISDNAGQDDTIERLTKERAEVELLKARLDIIPVATGAPRCKLCGVLIEDDFHNLFCSTCCAR